MVSMKEKDRHFDKIRIWAAGAVDRQQSVVRVEHRLPPDVKVEFRSITDIRCGGKATVTTCQRVVSSHSAGEGKGLGL